MLKSLTADFKDTRLQIPDLKPNDKINCVEIVDGKEAPSSLDMFIGTERGLLYNYKHSS
jgi:hypothetical protein